MANSTEWTERVAAWRASGLTAKAYCAGREFSAGALHFWSSKLNRERKAHRPVKLARVVRAHGSEQGHGVALVVELHGARIVVPIGVDGATLTRVVTALREANAP
jgi:hypothetical protein